MGVKWSEKKKRKVEKSLNKAVFSKFKVGPIKTRKTTNQKVGGSSPSWRTKQAAHKVFCERLAFLHLPKGRTATLGVSCALAQNGKSGEKAAGFTRGLLF